MSEKKAFENNEVLLWGRKKAKTELLDKYDHGNKNPKSKVKLIKETTKVSKKPIINREFDENEIYTIDDIDYLNKEYNKIDDEISKITDLDKMEELVDIQDKIYNIIEKLEKEKYEQEDKQYEEINNDNDIYNQIKKLNEEIDNLRQKYIESKGDIKYRNKIEDIEEQISKLHKKNKPVSKSGKSINTHIHNRDKESDIKDSVIIEKIIKMVGKGFKKGSPEALLHAEKMRKALETKKQPKIIEPIQKKETKSRVQKGSEEAKALGKRLAEAKKAKLEAKKKDEEEIKRIEKLKNPTKPKGRPWFYIGDIPKGYREASEAEAIEKGKVSEYGKYEVDETKYFLWNDFKILLDEFKNIKEVEWTLNGLKKRIVKSLQEIEILKSKLENNKYSDRSNEFKNKLIFEKELRRHLQAGWNWYYKIYCNMKGIKYERKSFNLPKKEEIKLTNETMQTDVNKIVPEKIIDPRTGKEAEMSYYSGENEKKNDSQKGDVDVDLLFNKGDETIKLSTKYFTEDYKLKPKYVEKLIKKNIILAKKHYTTDDYKKHFYQMMIGNGVYKLI